MSNLYSPTALTRLLSKVKIDPASGCWLWQASKNKQGYGHFSRGFWRGPKLKALAHRASWELHVGPIPRGMVVCHSCDIPSCINPKHLFLGSQAANVADARAKGRWAFKSHCKHGHEMVEPNLFYEKRGDRTFRKCKQCRNNRARDWNRVHFGWKPRLRAL